MSDISQFLNAAAVGAQVRAITGNNSSAAAAAGYAAWIAACTGSTPAVTSLDGSRAGMQLSASQVALMQQWLDKQLTSAVTPMDRKPDVEYNMGTFLTPWSMKYVIPGAVLVFVLGWVASYYIRG